MEFEVVTSAERPDLEAEATAAFRERWPEFIFHDDLVSAHMERVGAYFPSYEIYLLAEGRVAAGGWGVPIRWDGDSAGLPDGYRSTLVAAVEGHEAGTPVDTLSFMAVAVASDFDRQGLAARVLEALIVRAARAGVSRVVAPIRPTGKHRYPQFAMADYMTWTGEDGLSVDPWIRTHQRMGATILGPAPDSMVISAGVADWESWAEMAFPVTGAYVVPEALNLLDVDRERDRAVYREENLWVRHR